MLEVSLILISVIMLIGFFGDLVFKKTDIPSIVWLLFLGLLLGPVFGILAQEPFLAVSGFFSAIAVIIILFEGGVKMDIYKLLQEAPKGTLLTLLSFIITVAVVTLITSALGFFYLKTSILHGILLGAIVGGISSPIVIPIVSKLAGISEKTKTILSIESALTDVLCIVVAIAIIQALQMGAGDIGFVFKSLSINFSVGFVFGVIAGILWLPIMRKVERYEFSYTLTLALLFLIYSVTQLLGGSGAIAVLTFGIILGNGSKIMPMLGYSNLAYQMSSTMIMFHSLIAFFIRTFFFVFLGLLVKITNPMNILIGVIISGGIILARVITMKLLAGRMGGLKEIDEKIITIMVPRGLAAAVLAYLPLQALPNDPFVKNLPDIVFTVIIMTTLISVIGIKYMKNKYGEEESKEEEEVKMPKPKVIESKQVKKEKK